MKLVTTNKINRLWKNGILPKLLEKLDKARVLTSTEQVQANTNAENVVGALVAKELINDLEQQPEWVYDSDGKITGYKTQIGGAGAVFPFSTSKLIATFTANTNVQTFDIKSACPDYKTLTTNNFMVAVTDVNINTISGGGTDGNGNISSSVMPTLSYNASTGILTLAATSVKKSGNNPSPGILYTVVSISGNIYRI